MNAVGDAAWVREPYGRGRWLLFIRRRGVVRLILSSRRRITGLRLRTTRIRWRVGKRVRVRQLR